MGNAKSSDSDYDPYGVRADPYGRRNDPDPHRRSADMYPRQTDDRYGGGGGSGGGGEPIYSTSTRDRRDEMRKPSNGYGPAARDNGYLARDNNGFPGRPREAGYRTEPGSSRSDPPPSYDLDHLATFTVGQHKGELITPEDGIRKLRQMEMTSGIWTMRVQLMIDSDNILIIEEKAGVEIERFSLPLVTDPMAVTNRDRRDIYNNIVLFTVREDTRRDSPTEMHIFQCISKPAQNIVDEILEAKEGRGRFSSYHINPPARDNGSREQDRLNAQHSALAADSYTPGPPIGREFRKSIRQREVDNESVLSDRTDRDVDQDMQLLNQCFDDIERFVGRLQQAAEAYKELDRRKKPRNKQAGHDGMLSMRARPPPAKDFIDIFQKFKLSFNLLAQLKAHIHDPNAPELVHFLFTPMSLVVEASKDSQNSTPDLASQVVTPLLTADAIDLLYNCLTSKESDLWRSLGKAWTTPKEKWKDYVPPYTPRFSPSVQEQRPTPPVQEQRPSSHREYDRRLDDRHDDRPPREHRDSRDLYRPPPDQRDSRSDPRDSRDDPRDSRSDARDSRGDPRDSRGDPRDSRDPYSQDSRGRRDMRPAYDDDRRYPSEHDSYQPRRPRGPSPDRPSSPRLSQPLSYEEEQRRFKDKLLNTSPYKCYEVVNERQGKNAKELSVKKGEILELLDGTKNWWKLRNARGEVGHAPYTIINEVRK